MIIFVETLLKEKTNKNNIIIKFKNNLNQKQRNNLIEVINKFFDDVKTIKVNYDMYNEFDYEYYLNCDILTPEQIDKFTNYISNKRNKSLWKDNGIVSVIFPKNKKGKGK